MKNTVKLIGFLVVLIFSEIVFGQQDPQYTQYMYNMNVLNPAYAGARGTLSLNLLGRKQWVGIEGAPETATLSFHSPMNKSVGLGFSVIYDQLGPVKETNSYADFSYTIRTSEEGNLAFGLKAGATFHDLNMAMLNSLNPDDGLNINADPNEVYLNFGAGAYYYTQKFYIGLSVPNILAKNHFEKNSGYVSRASERSHYFLAMGYVFDISENVQLKPSTMLKGASGVPLSVDFSGNVLINNLLEFGLSYRLDDALSAMVGFSLNPDVRIGYAYDHTLSSFRNYNSGSHGVMLLVDFNRRKIKSPRFF